MTSVRLAILELLDALGDDGRVLTVLLTLRDPEASAAFFRLVDGHPSAMHGLSAALLPPRGWPTVAANENGIA